MLVKMQTQISGTRDGVDWPAPGEIVNVSDDEAAMLVANGLAEIADQPKPKGKAGQ